jgi:hypothetical protein
MMNEARLLKTSLRCCLHTAPRALNGWMQRRHSDWCFGVCCNCCRPTSSRCQDLQGSWVRARAADHCLCVGDATCTNQSSLQCRRCARPALPYANVTDCALVVRKSLVQTRAFRVVRLSFASEPAMAPTNQPLPLQIDLARREERLVYHAAFSSYPSLFVRSLPVGHCLQLMLAHRCRLC